VNDPNASLGVGIVHACKAVDVRWTVVVVVVVAIPVDDDDEIGAVKKRFDRELANASIGTIAMATSMQRRRKEFIIVWLSVGRFGLAALIGR